MRFYGFAEQVLNARAQVAFMLLLSNFIILSSFIKYADAVTPLNYPENHCLSFDGVDDYVECSSLDAYKASKFTIELWIKPKYPIQKGSNQEYKHQYGSLVSCGDGWTVELDYWLGSLLVGIKHDVMLGVHGGRQTWEPLWHHIAVVYDPDLPTSNLKVYVNGTLDWYHDPSLGNITYSLANMKIGEHNPFVDDSFCGLIDEVRYWNVCRSSVEINDSSNRVLTDSELHSPELVGYWRFDEGNGTSSHDYSLQHNNAFFPTSPSDPSWTSYGAPIIPEFPSPDIAPPIISVLSPENKTYATNSVSLSFTVDEAASWIGYSLDGRTNVTITGNTTLSGLSGGSHSLMVYAKDTSGNTGASETVCFTIKTKKAEPFLTWIVAAIVIMTVAGVTVLVYFTKVKK